VNDFNYLGVVFNYTGSFTLNQEHLTGKALKAMNILLSKCHDYDLKPKILCQLFDAFVGSILNYASEVWGYTKSKELERIHLKFCKRLLKVKLNTCNACVYGELGRYPMYINRYMRIIKYWFNIRRSKNIIIKTVYNLTVSDYHKGCHNWIFNVKKMLDDYGFSYVFDDVTNINIDTYTFVEEFKRRVYDHFTQDWYGTLNNSSMLHVYRSFKINFEYESYLDIIPRSLRYLFTRLRLSAHPLHIQTGRYARQIISRNQRYCICCDSTDIEDEFHFICICPTFGNIRKKYIKACYYIRPSMYKYLSLLQTNNKTELINICLYVKESLKVRTSILNARIL